MPIYILIGLAFVYTPYLFIVKKDNQCNSTFYKIISTSMILQRKHTIIIADRGAVNLLNHYIKTIEKNKNEKFI